MSATKSYKCQRLVMDGFGDPTKVLSLEETDEKLVPQRDEVLIETMLVSVNPADINMIQGRYPVKPDKFPATPGIEGVGKILDTGPEVTTLARGDIVINDGIAFGTWQSHRICSHDHLTKVPVGVPVTEAAGLGINVVTAYRLIKDFVTLRPGDVIIQNGANSSCGQNVIQLCKQWGVRTINIVRGRPDFRELEDHLTSLGADIVVEEDQVRTLTPDQLGSAPKLGLNCVGGKSVNGLIRLMAPGSTVVTYGGMSMEPLTIPTSTFIFQDLHFSGFWLKTWITEHKNTVAWAEMMNELFEMAQSNRLKAPACKTVPVKEYQTAIKNTLSTRGFISHKYFIEFKR